MASNANPVRDFAMSPAGGWLVVNGDFATVAGAAAVPQGIAIHLRTFFSECMLDGSKGIDWINQVFIKGADPFVVETLIKDEIEQVPDVLEAEAVDFLGPDSDRVATTDWQVQTIYSQNSLVGKTQVSQ